MPSDALSNREDCLGRVCPSHPSALGALYSLWSLNGHMGHILKQPHSNFVFALPGNPRLGHKPRPRRAETVSGGETGLARVRERHSVIREAQKEAKPALL